MRRPNSILALLVLIACAVSSQPSSVEFPIGKHDQPLRWATKTIQIALSTSLILPSSSIRPESDVIGTVHRALNRWSNVANITFVLVSSRAQSISPANRGDGINLITIAPTAENLGVFAEGNDAARTRLFYDPSTGVITEADIVINPFPYSPEGEQLQFSTDATPGTYDLESMLAHEIGHLLGLHHSRVMAATMQPSQGLNGTYGLPAVTERTLSESDRTAIRTIYGPCENSGSVKGRIQNSNDGKLTPANSAHVWFEDLTSGRVVASTLTTSGGRFNIGCVPAGDYRVMIQYVDQAGEESAIGGFSEFDQAARRRAFRSLEISGQLRVAAEKAATLSYVAVPPQSLAPQLIPRLLGTSAQLSTVPLPAEAGTRVTLYVGGEGVNQVPGSGLTFGSPFITVDPSSLTLQQFHNSIPVISIEVIVASNAPPGDYTVRLQSNSGEIAYLPGGLTINPSF